MLQTLETPPTPESHLASDWQTERIQQLEATLVAIAVGRKWCVSGTQRISRDELKTMARECCERLGIRWDVPRAA
jgi:hypothetical protein